MRIIFFFLGGGRVQFSKFVHLSTAQVFFFLITQLDVGLAWLNLQYNRLYTMYTLKPTLYNRVERGNELYLILKP